MIRCNSCGGTYPKNTGNTAVYFHVCPDEIVDQPEQVNDKNEIVKPATRKPTPNPRNENLKSGRENRFESSMVSEGSGTTEVE